MLCWGRSLRLDASVTKQPMQTFIILSRLPPGCLQPPRSLEELERQVADPEAGGADCA